MTKTAVNIAGIAMKNPVCTASGTFGYGEEFSKFYDISRLGGIMVKGVSAEPWLGNKGVRIAETASGMLNSVGLQNPGVDYFLEHYLPELRKKDIAVIVNVAGHAVEEYAAAVEKLEGHDGIAGLEVNISCPNLKAGGLAYGTDPEMAAEVTREVRKRTKLPVIMKLSPNVTSIAEIAKAVEAAGADGVSLINTLLGMAIDVKTRRPVLGNVVGGLSGPAIKPVALRMVWQVHQAVQIPIIGMGGIVTATDAIEFLLAGASGVAIGCGNFINPMTAVEVVEGIEAWLEKEGVADVNDIIGGLQVG